MAKPRISVAMCTYNGAPFLGAQLESIRAQTRLPDELVICDDVSTDDTVAIARSFQAMVPFPIRVVVNTTNLGSTGNFAQAIRLCEGDVILTADQDDCWRPEKVEQIITTFAAHPAAGLVFSDGELVDAELQPLGSTLWRAFDFTPHEQRLLHTGRAAEVLVRHNVVTGAAMAFRSEWRELLLPIPERWIHDAWIALVIAGVADLVCLPAPLIAYRRHERQQIGAPATIPGGEGGFVGRLQREGRRFRHAYEKISVVLRNRIDRRNDVEMDQIVQQHYAEVVTRLERLPATARRDALLRRIIEKVSHVHRRATLPSRFMARVPVVTRELIGARYSRYACTQSTPGARPAYDRWLDVELFSHRKKRWLCTAWAVMKDLLAGGGASWH